MASQNIPGKGTGDRDAAGDDVAAALAEVARLDAEAGAALDAAGAAGTLVPACPGGAGAEEARSAMIAAQGQAAGTLQRLQAGRQRVADLIAARKRALDAELASMSAALRPFQEQVAHMQEAIWSVSLYLGGTNPAGVHQRRRQRLSAGSTLTIELQNSSAGMGAMMSRCPLATRVD